MISRKFRVIYDDLAEEIISGNFEIGSYLPSEPQLSEYYHVSRETIRKALNLLTHEGMIQKIRGKGSLVLGQPLSAEDSLLDSTKTNSLSQKQYKVVEFSHVQLSVKQFIHDPNEVLDRLSFYKIGQLCLLNKTPSFLQYTYLVTSLFPDLKEEDIDGNLDKLIQSSINQPVGFIKREIVIESAEFIDAQYLEIQAGDPLGVIKEKTYLNTSELLMVSSAKYTAQNFRYNDFINK
ncbi:GntR family transcriptional regulator [Enterococcus sp. DIV0800]|uniref:GntR family transcriptional regulator n=1 Tax=unclassified Enterococcus TaxID=2608891 RepID=UPI003D300B86